MQHAAVGDDYDVDDDDGCWFIDASRMRALVFRDGVVDRREQWIFLVLFSSAELLSIAAACKAANWQMTEAYGYDKTSGFHSSTPLSSEWRSELVIICVLHILSKKIKINVGREQEFLDHLLPFAV